MCGILENKPLKVIVIDQVVHGEVDFPTKAHLSMMHACEA